jgi:hypothetical protein
LHASISDHDGTKAMIPKRKYLDNYWAQLRDKLAGAL